MRNSSVRLSSRAAWASRYRHPVGHTRKSHKIDYGTKTLGAGQGIAATFAIGDKLRGLAAGAAFTNSSY
ncbi:hypothetical protein MPL3356_280043 [Mesorhizobium plurifarium]|uniref:Uncharacterized protein n=1 Tax=Mesorhizobium plurifarium TaxID=69974 RepID=A0A090DPX3_MESPL|nr:hypothetical protein MPL3356_280043 [Mesorhizobium plurifarium]